MSTRKASDFKVGGGAVCVKETAWFTKGQWYFVSKIEGGSLTLIDNHNDTTYVQTLNNFVPFPNEPLPHSRERIAYAMGAEIEVHVNGTWTTIRTTPAFHPANLYRVKTPETETQTQKSIRVLEEKIGDMTQELANMRGDN